VVHLFSLNFLFLSCIKQEKKVLSMAVLGKRLEEFIGLHKDQKIVVCGCGTSLSEFKSVHSDYITIGVNDVPLLFQPTYLLVTDSPGRFRTETRVKMVNGSTANYLFTCAKGWRHRNIVYFELGSQAAKNLNSRTKIDHFVHSPYCAVGLAYKMGAKHIGLIGVDFTNGHFYNPRDGAHPVIQMNYLKRVNSVYSAMLTALSGNGVSLYNLSRQSLLEVPKITIDEFSKL
jgi:hypothetical protein